MGLIMKSGVLLGIGIGGLTDGIVLHHILQWHNMLSARVPPVSMTAMTQNMLCDGLFDLVMLCIAVVGIALLWREARAGIAFESGTSFMGHVLVGWGAFNVIEGLVDHEWLGLHHVRDLPVFIPIYDWWFLAVAGIGAALLGALLTMVGQCGADEPAASLGLQYPADRRHR
jgi:uncharacterized membrane protein